MAGDTFHHPSQCVVCVIGVHDLAIVCSTGDVHEAEVELKFSPSVKYLAVRSSITQYASVRVHASAWPHGRRLAVMNIDCGDVQTDHLFPWAQDGETLHVLSMCSSRQDTQIKESSACATTGKEQRCRALPDTTGKRPISLSPKAHFAVVKHQLNNLQTIDATTGQLLLQLPNSCPSSGIWDGTWHPSDGAIIVVQEGCTSVPGISLPAGATTFVCSLAGICCGAISDWVPLTSTLLCAPSSGRAQAVAGEAYHAGSRVRATTTAKDWYPAMLVINTDSHNMTSIIAGAVDQGAVLTNSSLSPCGIYVGVTSVTKGSNALNRPFRTNASVYRASSGLPCYNMVVQCSLSHTTECHTPHIAWSPNSHWLACYFEGQHGAQSLQIVSMGTWQNVSCVQLAPHVHKVHQITWSPECCGIAMDTEDVTGVIGIKSSRILRFSA